MFITFLAITFQGCQFAGLSVVRVIGYQGYQSQRLSNTRFVHPSLPLFVTCSWVEFLVHVAFEIDVPGGNVILLGVDPKL